MTFQESIKLCLTKKYADFNGRAARPEYWWFALFIILVSIALSYINNVVSILFNLAVLLPSLAAAARRLHDTNRSGWWQLIALIPILGTIVLIVFLALAGDAESNEHGAPPVA